MQNALSAATEANSTQRCSWRITAAFNGPPKPRSQVFHL